MLKYLCQISKKLNLTQKMREEKFDFEAFVRVA